MVKKGSEPDSKNVILDKRPCFFKIFLVGLGLTQQLRVPPHFKKYLPGDLPHGHRALLRGPCGGIWYVEVIRVANDIFLKDGWQQFVKDHSLGKNEFLLFTYDGDLCFNVQIFDAHGTERLCMSDPPKHKQPTAPVNDRAGHNHSRRLRGLKRSMEERSSEGKVRQEKVELHFDGKNGCGEKGKTNMDHQEAVKSFSSKLPYFEKRLRIYNVQSSNVLAVPNSFARQFLFSKKTKMILRNQEEKTWEVNFIPSRCPDGYRFTGGWVGFVHDNNLKENDICIFELVGLNEMKVYVYRS